MEIQLKRKDGGLFIYLHSNFRQMIVGTRTIEAMQSNN